MTNALVQATAGITGPAVPVSPHVTSNFEFRRRHPLFADLEQCVLFTAKATRLTFFCAFKTTTTGPLVDPPSQPSFSFQAKSVTGAVQTAPVKLPPHAPAQDGTMYGPRVGRPAKTKSAIHQILYSEKRTCDIRPP